MNRYGSLRDVTANVRCAQPSAPHLLLYMCSTAKEKHKGPRLGGHFWNGQPMRCPACNAKREAA